MGKTKERPAAALNGHAEPVKTQSWSDDENREAKSKAHLLSMPKLDVRHIHLKIIGDAPLICNRWSEKAKKQMLDKQMGTATAGKEFKVPEADFEASLYKIPGGGYGFPAIAFKNAAVSACTSLGKSITKVAARQAFHVVGELVPIVGEPVPREDMVRVGMGTADIRYRAEFKAWSCKIVIRYNARVLSDEQIVNLVNTAGFAVGIGEWRPERDGQYGLFHVE